MKLLLDQNISRKLVRRLEDIFPNTKHVSEVLTETSDDGEIWSFAKEHGYVIVTKDDDFEQRSILYGHPPKLIWLRLGNCRTADIETLLRLSIDILHAFESDEQASFLPLP